MTSVKRRFELMTKMTDFRQKRVWVLSILFDKISIRKE